METSEVQDLKARVKTAIDQIRPSLQADGGDIKLIAVSENGQVSVQLQGACKGCPMSQMTLTHGVEKHLKSAIPEVTRVVSV
jgi:Fe-S cluster biogenesis protein NfuA